jgi:SAM-dependent methyltransferase
MASPWDDIARQPNPSGYLDPLVARQKRAAHLDLLHRWSGHDAPERVLKTDLFEEAFGEDTVLFNALPGARLTVGIDVAAFTVAQACGRAPAAAYAFLAADARGLPFQSGAFDLILSNSTLDHFETRAELRAALAELARVVRPGGTLVITLDNPWNPLYHLLRAAMRLKSAPYGLGQTASRAQLSVWLAECGLEVVAHDWLIHNPRLLSTLLFMGLRKAFGRAADAPVGLLLKLFALFGRLPTRPLTACFVAIRACKPEDRRA